MVDDRALGVCDAAVRCDGGRLERKVSTERPQELVRAHLLPRQGGVLALEVFFKGLLRAAVVVIVMVVVMLPDDD